jgi:glycerophosphoryl diester phosphodiesterase
MCDTIGATLRFIVIEQEESMWPYPKVVAHRGGGKLAPENTLAAMRCGLARGFHAVEFDVMLSRDGIPVLMHDPDLGRTVHGTGRICDFTAQELTAMDAGAWFGPEFTGERIPLYRDVLEFCKTNSIWMNVEIKPIEGFERETGRVVGEMTRRIFADGIAAGDVSKLPLFSSFSFDAVMAAKLAAPDIPRGFLVEEIPSDWREQLEALDAVALHTDHEKLTQPLARAIKQAGYGLFCYTVNDMQRAREIMSWGVDGFCTDCIDLIAFDFV